MARGAPIYKLTQPKEPLRVSAPVVLVRLQEMLDLSQAIDDPARVDDLHNMRIAAKRLRYTLELFLPTLGPDAPRLLKTVEAIQERIGAIHDCDVLLPLLEETLQKEEEREKKAALKKGRLPSRLAAEGLVPLMARKREERDRLFREFLGFWHGLPPAVFAAELTRLVALPPPDKSDKKSGPENKEAEA